jgi:methionyl-tRNA synthetase
MDQKIDNSQYLANLEALVRARTEQLRTAVTLIDELVAALKPFRPELAQKAVESLQQGLTTESI